MQERGEEHHGQQPVPDRCNALAAASAPAAACPQLAGGGAARPGRETPLDGGDHQIPDTHLELLVELADAGGAGDVDSVTKPPMTSRPTNSMPWAASTGPIWAASQRSRSFSGRPTPAPAARLPRWSSAEGMRARA